ncbi:hypothetical protein FACS189451_04480 [Bacteroidia bacterium]|nr:hypothetical protein FACS189451_04480 [Bacteroidia bacterium]
MREFACNKQEIAENSGNFSTYFNTPDSIVKNLQDFIVLLQEENKRLKKEIDFLSGLSGESVSS